MGRASSPTGELVTRGRGRSTSCLLPRRLTGFFFFQAEDGIRDYRGLEFRRVLFRSDRKSTRLKTALRDYRVTGVQTCALPIRSEEHTSENQSQSRRARDHYKQEH